MTEELLYLGLLIKSSKVYSNYELSLALSLVSNKYPELSQQDVQESFEELATCFIRDLPLPRVNKFYPIARQYAKEN